MLSGCMSNCLFKVSKFVTHLQSSIKFWKFLHNYVHPRMCIVTQCRTMILYPKLIPTFFSPIRAEAEFHADLGWPPLPGADGAGGDGCRGRRDSHVHGHDRCLPPWPQRPSRVWHGWQNIRQVSSLVSTECFIDRSFIWFLLLVSTLHTLVVARSGKLRQA